jgi:chromosome condensin MukBEF ATPase and DNA-binding subunit MukB
MDMADMDRDVGRLEARMEMVEAELQGIRRDVREIRDALVSARGGWLLMVTLVSCAVATGAFLKSYLPLLFRALQ